MFLIQFPLVLPTTGKANNISHVAVSLVNPWSAPLQINKVSSTVTSFGLSLGTIESTTGFTVSAKSTTQSPTLDLNMNFDPAVLFTVTRALAVEAGLDVEPLDGIVQLGGISYLTIASPAIEKRQNADLYKFVQNQQSLLERISHLEQGIRLAQLRADCIQKTPFECTTGCGHHHR